MHRYAQELLKSAIQSIERNGEKSEGPRARDQQILCDRRYAKKAIPSSFNLCA